MKKTLFSFFIILGILPQLSAQDIKISDIITYVEIPAVEQKITLRGKDIQNMEAPDLPSLLQTAGIQLLSYGPYGLEQKPSIRGFTDETVRVIIDGVCVNNAQYGTFDFSTININDIEQIEIVKGGFTESVYDEGAVGGAIYITTKKQQLGLHFFSDSALRTYFNLNHPVDTFSQNLGLNFQTGDKDFFITTAKFNLANNSYLYKNYYNKIAERKNAKVIDGSSKINYQHFFDKGNSLNITNLFYGGNKNTPGNESLKNYGKQKDYDNIFTIQTNQPAALKGLRINNSISWLSNTRFYTDKNSDSKHYVNTIKYSGETYLYRFKNLRNSFGLTLDYTYLDSTDDGIHNQLSGAVKNNFKYTINLPEKNENHTNNLVFTLPLALRFSGSNLAFAPKLGFGWKTTFGDILIDGYRMIQFPNMDDLYWDDGMYHGNPDLKPETGWGGDLTVNIHNTPLPLSLCLYTNYYENKIQWAGLMPQNVASAFYLGVDTSVKANLFKEKLTLSGNFEYLYTRLLDKSKNTYGKKIMWTPDFTGSLTIGFNIPKGKLNLETSYMGKRYLTNANISFLEPYFLLNFYGSFDFQKNNWKFSPYFRFDNLLNTEYEAVKDYPMPGISFTTGCKVYFDK